MLDYQPGPFRAEFARAYGAETWECLNERETVEMMVSASQDRLPAVAGVERRLASFVPADARTHRWRQMVGHMIRQVMAERGFAVENSRVSLGSSGLFTRGAMYGEQE